jgi:hypothetical protein
MMDTGNFMRHVEVDMQQKKIATVVVSIVSIVLIRIAGGPVFRAKYSTVSCVHIATYA